MRIHHNSLEIALSGLGKLRTLTRYFVTAAAHSNDKPMNLEDARAQMLGQQIRAWEVLDERILGVLGEMPRENFVPEEYRDLAFADTEIPLSHGQYMMAPKVEGRLLQALELSPTDTVLEVGTGSGFLTACLAELTDSVVSLDIFEDFAAEAARKLDAVDIRNVTLETAIAVTGSVSSLDEHFVRMLSPGGRLFIVVGRAPVMEARLITVDENGQRTHTSLFETVVPPLLNAEQPEPFVL